MKILSSLQQNRKLFSSFQYTLSVCDNVTLLLIEGAQMIKNDYLKYYFTETEKTMKSIILFCLIAASVASGPPIPLPGGSEDSLAPQCRTPKCPTTFTNTETPITLPYPLDCLQYVICEESGPRTVACPPDLVFNKVSYYVYLALLMRPIHSIFD